MTSTNASRKAKIQAAAPKGGGGASRIVVATVVLVLVIVAIVVAVVLGSQKKDTAATAGGSSLPKGAPARGAGIVVNPGAPASVPTMDLYEDFQCPVCGAFERAFGPQVTQLAEQNQVKLVVHTLSFLDDNLHNDSSNRAANAASCAADQDRFLPYHAAVFAGQPAQEGQGYTDAQLRQFATTAGITGSALQSWQQCYDARAHNQYVESVQTQSEKDGVNGTPTIKLNGKKLDLSTLTGPQSLNDAVKAAGR
jgi:protein-disulfide isomerase